MRYIVYSIALLWVALIVGCGRNTPVVPKPPPVVLRLESERKIYNLGDKIVIKQYIKNLSTQPLAFAISPAKEITKFQHTTDAGQKRVKSDTVLPEEQTAMPFLLIPASEQAFVGSGEYDQTYFDQVGIWTISTTSYYALSDRKLGVTLWTGTLASAELSIVVKGRSSPTKPSRATQESAPGASP